MPNKDSSQTMTRPEWNLGNASSMGAKVTVVPFFFTCSLSLLLCSKYESARDHPHVC